MKKLLLFFLFFDHYVYSQWSAFGPNGVTDRTVVDFEYYNNELYATGLFTKINGVAARTVAKWTGSTWVQSGTFTDWGHSIRTIDTVMYLAKYRALRDSNNVWYYNGSSWKKLGQAFSLVGGVTSLKPDLYDVIKYNGDLYVCGEFNRCGPDTIKGIARWDGTKWTKCGVGLEGAIPGGPPNIYPHQMHVFNNKLFIVGNFQNAGGVTCNGIAAWDGTNWTSLSTGFNKTAYGVSSFQGELYAGGEFTLAGTNAVGGIAKWDGSQWVQPGFSLSTINPASGNFCFVHSFEVIHNKLYIAGGFNRLTATGTSTVGNIMAYDGVNTFDMDKGSNSDIEAMIGMPATNAILVGGIFNRVGSTSLSCNSLAIYDPDITTGIGEINLNKEYSIYPNPTQNKISISGPVKITTVQVTDIAGRLIKDVSLVNSSEVEVDLSACQNGIYLIRIITAGGIVCEKIIKSD